MATKSGHTIYKLTDPRTGAARYVGVTSETLSRRLSGHWSHRTRAAMCSEWLRELEALNLRPLAIALESVESYPREHEDKWIARLRKAGEPLLNKVQLAHCFYIPHQTGVLFGKCLTAEQAREIFPEATLYFGHESVACVDKRT
jgi:hypothetical protein